MNKRGNAKVSAGEFQGKKNRTEKEELSVRIVFHRFAACKGIKDIQRFWIPRRGFRITSTSFQYLSFNLDSGLQSLVGFWFPSVVFRIPKPSIPDSTFKIFWDSGFHVIFRAGSYFKRNRNLSYLLFSCGNAVSETNIRNID